MSWSTIEAALAGNEEALAALKAVKAESLEASKGRDAAAAEARKAAKALEAQGAKLATLEAQVASAQEGAGEQVAKLSEQLAQATAQAQQAQTALSETQLANALRWRLAQGTKGADGEVRHRVPADRLDAALKVLGVPEGLALEGGQLVGLDAPLEAFARDNPWAFEASQGRGQAGTAGRPQGGDPPPARPQNTGGGDFAGFGAAAVRAHYGAAAAAHRTEH